MKDYDCTEDCNGYEAGYNWAENNSIEDGNDCDGNSNSFNEVVWDMFNKTIKLE